MLSLPQSRPVMLQFYEDMAEMLEISLPCECLIETNVDTSSIMHFCYYWFLSRVAGGRKEWNQ